MEDAFIVEDTQSKDSSSGSTQRPDLTTGDMRAPIILDRDAVINHSNRTMPGRGWYVRCWNDFQFMDGAEEAIVDLIDAGHPVFIVTMQNCVVDGNLHPFEVEEIHDQLIEYISRNTEGGDTITHICTCSTPTNEYREWVYAKRDAMIFLSSKYGFRLADAVVVGDSSHDVESGALLGCTTIHIQLPGWPPCDSAGMVADSLRSAVTHILEESQ